MSGELRVWPANMRLAPKVLVIQQDFALCFLVVLMLSHFDVPQTFRWDFHIQMPSDLFRVDYSDVRSPQMV